MENTYEIVKKEEGLYTFTTKNGTKYSLEIEKSNAKYITSELKEEKYINFFSFSLIDANYAVESDLVTRNTIVEFVLKHLLNKENDTFMFFINNELEDETNSKFRGTIRSKLFKRLMNKVNITGNKELIFFTNHHFVLDPRSYRGDYVGIIIDSNSKDYINIIRTFNAFCYINSYKESKS